MGRAGRGERRTGLEQHKGQRSASRARRRDELQLAGWRPIPLECWRAVLLATWPLSLALALSLLFPLAKRRCFFALSVSLFCLFLSVSFFIIRGPLFFFCLPLLCSFPFFSISHLLHFTTFSFFSFYQFSRVSSCSRSLSASCFARSLSHIFLFYLSASRLMSFECLLVSFPFLCFYLMTMYFTVFLFA